MLIAYQVALDLVRALRPVVAQLRRHSRDAADQVERAASSVVLNLAEGYRRHGRDPRRFWDMAHGSAGEIRGALDLADAWGWQIECAQARTLLDRELRLLWGLTRRARGKESPELTSLSGTAGEGRVPVSSSRFRGRSGSGSVGSRSSADTR